MVTFANQSELPPNEEKKKLSEVCERYGICRRTLGNYMKEGRLRAVRLGKKLLYTTFEEVERAMQPVQIATCESPVSSQSEIREVERLTKEVRERFGI